MSVSQSRPRPPASRVAGHAHADGRPRGHGLSPPAAPQRRPAWAGQVLGAPAGFQRPTRNMESAREGGLAVGRECARERGRIGLCKDTWWRWRPPRPGAAPHGLPGRVFEPPWGGSSREGPASEGGRLRSTVPAAGLAGAERSPSGTSNVAPNLRPRRSQQVLLCCDLNKTQPGKSLPAAPPATWATTAGRPPGTGARQGTTLWKSSDKW